MADEWKTSGMTVAEYATWVRFAEPQAAALPLYAALSERYNLVIGSSGGYTSSGHYNFYSRQHFNINNYHVVGDVMSAFYNMAGNVNAAWVKPDILSGGTAGKWIVAMNELLSSAGLAAFADNSHPNSYVIPRMTPAHAADIYIGVASAISLLQYQPTNINVGGVMRESMYYNGSTTTSSSYFGNFYDFEYYAANNSGFPEGNVYVNLRRPLSAVISGGAHVDRMVSAVISGNVSVWSDGSPRVEYAEPTMNISTIVPAGTQSAYTFSGYYLYGKTVTQLLPALGSHAGAYTSNYPSGWMGHPGLFYTESGNVSSVYGVNLIGSAAIFLNQ